MWNKQWTDCVRRIFITNICFYLHIIIYHQLFLVISWPEVLIINRLGCDPVCEPMCFEVAVMAHSCRSHVTSQNLQETSVTCFPGDNYDSVCIRFAHFPCRRWTTDEVTRVEKETESKRLQEVNKHAMYFGLRHFFVDSSCIFERNKPLHVVLLWENNQWQAGVIEHIHRYHPEVF